MEFIIKLKDFIKKNSISDESIPPIITDKNKLKINFLEKRVSITAKKGDKILKNSFSGFTLKKF